MKRNSFLLSALLLTSFFYSNAQTLNPVSGSPVFSKRYYRTPIPHSKDTSYKSFASVVNDDQSIVTAGNTFEGYNRACLTKFDKDGNVLWCKKYNTGSPETFRKIKKTDDQGYIILGDNRGYLYFPYGSNFFHLLKIDSSGNVQWSKTFNTTGKNSCVPESIRQIADGSFVVCGTFWPSRAELHGIFVTKVDSNGDILWDNVYSETGNSAYSPSAYDLAENQANLIITGNHVTGYNIYSGFILTISTKKGAPVSTKTIHINNQNNYFKDIFSIKNGFLINSTDLTPGYLFSGDQTFFNYSNDGTLSNFVHVLGSDVQAEAGPVVPTKDGGVLFVTKSVFNNYRNVSKINVTGSIAWTNRYEYGNTNNYYTDGPQFTDIKKTNDGGFVITGYNQFDDNIGYNYACVEITKIDSLGNFGSSCPQKTNTVTVSVPAYTVDTITSFQIITKKKFTPANAAITISNLIVSTETACENTTRFNKEFISKVQSVVLDVFPNPATDKFSVQLSNKKNIVSITIYNQFGNIVMKRKLNSNSLVINRYEIGDKAGIYFINIQTADGSFVKKELRLL